MKTRVLTLLIAAFTLSATAQQQNSAHRAEQADSLNLTIKSAIEIAISDNPTIKIAGQEIERQKYVKKETQGNLMPNLTGSGSYGYNLMNPVMFMPENVFGPGTGGAMRMGFANSFTGGLSLSIPLFVPTVYQALKLNDEQMQQAVEQARSSKINLATSVKKSYYGVLLAKTSIELISENIALAEEIVRTNQNAYNQGVVSEYDLIASKVQLSNLNPTLYEAQSALYNSRLMLNMLIGLPLNTPIRLEEDLTSFTDYINDNNDHQIDLENNSDLKLIEIQQRMLELQLKAQKAGRIPTLAAVGQYQVLSQNNTLDIGSYDWRGTASVGLQLSIPIFAGLKNINKERQIKNQKFQLELQRDYLEQSLSVEVQSAISNIESAKKQMDANLEAKEQAKKGYKIAKTRYETGLGTIVDLNQAQVQLMQADMGYSQSIFNYMSAQADYDKAVGNDF